MSDTVQTVWALTITQDNDIRFCIYGTRKAALRALYKYARAGWADVVNMPKTPKELVKAYFAERENASWSLVNLAVQH